jgi:hypothetical protein
MSLPWSLLARAVVYPYADIRSIATLGFNHSMVAYISFNSMAPSFGGTTSSRRPATTGGGQDPDVRGYLGCVVPAHGNACKSVNVTMTTYALTYEW